MAFFFVCDEKYFCGEIIFLCVNIFLCVCENKSFVFLCGVVNILCVCVKL